MAAVSSSRHGLCLSPFSRRSSSPWRLWQLKASRPKASSTVQRSGETTDGVNLDKPLQEAFDAQRLLEAIRYEADQGCLNFKGKARFSKFLRGQLEAWVLFVKSPTFDEPRTKAIVSLLKEARKYTGAPPRQRRALLDKVAILLGFEKPLATSPHAEAADSALFAATRDAPLAAVQPPVSPDPMEERSLYSNNTAVTETPTRERKPRTQAPKSLPDLHMSADRGMSAEAGTGPDWPDVHMPADRGMSAETGTGAETGQGKKSWKEILSRHHPGISFGSSEPVDLSSLAEEKGGQFVRRREEERTAVASMAVEAMEEEGGEKAARREASAISEQVYEKVVEELKVEDADVSLGDCKSSAAGGSTAKAKRSVGESRKGRKKEKVGGEEREVLERGGGEGGGAEVTTRVRVAFRGEGEGPSGSGCLHPHWLLDTPISKVECLAKWQRVKLEEEGFVTVRSLLQHYPRFYANYEMAHQEIEEGQHVTCIGKIISSRGYSKGGSLGIVEVTIEYRPKPPAGLESSESEGEEEAEVETPDPVYIRLYRFFRGARFTSSGFLHKIATQYPLWARASVTGKVKALSQANYFTMSTYEIKLLDDESPEAGDFSSDEDSTPFSAAASGAMGGGLQPVYPAKGTLKSQAVGECIRAVVNLLPGDLDPIPEEERRALGLMELRESLQSIHIPKVSSAADQARNRLIFDEFLYHQLGLLLLRRQSIAALVDPSDPTASDQTGGSLPPSSWSPLSRKLLHSLPYTLTRAQMRVVSETLWDLRQGAPMSRLLQGDVGCGKTIVALLALIEVIAMGYQGALMAPTEFLAQQHFAHFTKLLASLDESERPALAILTGSTPTKRAKGIREEIRTGAVRLVVGTHSLISRSLEFPCLGLAVIDEQHRFGVDQRQQLQLKGAPTSTTDSHSHTNPQGVAPMSVPLRSPHVLAMSATPIPRSLALALHGDMALSQIDELPPGRTPITTRVMSGTTSSRKKAYALLRKQVADGGRAFVIFPVIEESDHFPDLRAAVDEYEELQKGHLAGLQCGLVHGRLPPADKEAAMRKFKEGETQVLVSTTVVEVGIDIPEASVMLVEHAERYGIAQLHQLRGRVGRGARQSLCVLLASTAASLTRLRALEKSQDGFYLAELDMQFRGPGDILGKRQSGHLPEFTLARLEEHGELLEKARAFAQRLLIEHPNLDGLPSLRRELSMRRPPIGLG